MQQPSTTALMVAGFRAKASAAPDAIIDDPWAAALVGDQIEQVTAGFLQAFPPMTLWIAVRTAFLDQCVRRFTASPYPIKQVVILGAGFDTRAGRLATPGVSFFEVDIAATQQEKRRRINSLPDYPQDAARYVTCDFESEDFVVKLTQIGFDPTAPALFLWEGVTYYLTEPAVKQTLATIAGCHQDSIVAFDFVGKEFIQRNIPQPQQASLDVVAGMGEPMQWGCNDIMPVLCGVGFQTVHTTRFDEACLALARTYDRSRMFRFQSLAIASPGTAYGLFVEKES